MRQWQRYVCSVVVALAVLCPVHARAQEPGRPEYMTGCITRDGESKQWNLGLLPLRSCARGETQVTLALKAAVDTLSAAGSAADKVLHASVGAEAAARQAADEELGAALASEVASRAAGDTALQQQITVNGDAIAATAVRIGAVEDEIGDKANNYAESRIDASSAAAGEVLGVIWSTEGGIEDYSSHYRTLVLNKTTGELALRGEIDHGLDFTAHDAYWYCTIGDQIANGDIQQHVENLPDDHAALAAVGLADYSSHWWSFKFEDTQGPAGNSPFARIQVWDSSGGGYVDVVPTARYPVTGWIMGRRSANGQTPDSAVRVGLSDRQLRELLAAEYRGVTLATSNNDNHVLVDLNYSVAKLR